MSDVVKWALLVAGAIVLIGLILALPFVDFINFEEFSAALTNVVSIAGGAFKFARGLLNNFFLPFGRTIITGVMIWLVGKWAVMVAIKIAAWIYHFIFK